MNQKKIFVTKEGLKKIEEELANLKSVKRKEIAERIQDAKELGDLSENAEYIEAKEEQGFIESRIIELSQMVKNVELISHQTNKNIVQIGSTVRVRDEEEKEERYLIVGSSEADPLNKKISNESPFGCAFLGHKVGDRVTIQTPKGTRVLGIVGIA